MYTEAADKQKLQVLIGQIEKVLQTNREMVRYVDKQYRDKSNDQTGHELRIKTIIESIRVNTKVEIEVNAQQLSGFIEEQYRQLNSRISGGEYIIEESITSYFKLLVDGHAKITIEARTLSDTIEMLITQNRLKSWEAVVLAYYHSNFATQSLGKQAFSPVRISHLKQHDKLKVTISYTIQGKLEDLIGRLTPVKSASKAQLSNNDPLLQYGKISQTKEVKSWLDGTFGNLLQEISTLSEVYRQKDRVYMFVGIALTVEYVEQEIKKKGGQILSEVNEQMKLALHNEKAIRRGLLQGILYGLFIGPMKMRDDIIQLDPESGIISVVMPKPDNKIQGYYYDEYDGDEGPSNMKSINSSTIESLMKGYKQLFQRDSPMRSISRFTVGFCLVWLAYYHPKATDVSAQLEQWLRPSH